MRDTVATIIGGVGLLAVAAVRMFLFGDSPNQRGTEGLVGLVNILTIAAVVVVVAVCAWRHAAAYVQYRRALRAMSIDDRKRFTEARRLHRKAVRGSRC